MLSAINAAVKSKKGVTVVEYCLVMVLIAIAIIVALGGIGQNSNKAYSKVNSTLSN